jgi:putative peptidoglycan lipid II flippase
MIVMCLMVISRILGFIRYKAIFYFFGRGVSTDAFFGAFTLPDTLYILVSGGAMSAAFIPVFSELLEKKKTEESWRLASALLNLTFLTVGPCVALGIIFAPQISHILLPGFSGKTLDLTIEITRILFPMVIFTTMSALYIGILQSHEHFWAPGISWSTHNIAMIAATILLHGIFGIKGVAYGVVAGAMSMVIIQLPVAIKKGMRYHFFLGLKDENVKKVLKLFLPALIGLSISQINLLIMPITFGSFMGKGAVTALQGSVRLFLVPVGVFGNALSMAIFPRLSQYAGVGRMDDFKTTLIRGINTTFAFSLPSLMVCILLGVPIVRALFGGGKFTVADCHATAYALAFYAIGLPGHTAVQTITRGYYALKDTKTPLYVGFFSVFFITIPFCIGLLGLKVFTISILQWHISMKPLMWLFRVSPFCYLGQLAKPLSFGGIALAVSVATLFNYFALLGLLKWRVKGISIAPVIFSMLRVGAATLVSGAACFALMRWVVAGLDPMIQMTVGLAVSGISFVAAGRFFKVSEIDEMLSMIKNRFRRQ